MALTRREFLAGGLSLTAGLSFGPHALARSIVSGQVASGLTASPVVVSILLEGGNDAFNTLVPYGQKAYYQARPHLALAGSDLLPLTDELALARPLEPLLKYFEQGKLALIPGVGCLSEDGASALTRSHSRAAQIWRSAQPDIIGDTSWLGGLAEPSSLSGSPGRDKAVQVKYPDGAFGQSLSEIAAQVSRLRAEKISAGAVAFETTLSGFDTHSNQKSRHAILLATLAAGLDAFMQDLADSPDYPVIVLVHSEFGRRLKENSGHVFGGFDHGFFAGMSAPLAVQADSVGTDHGSSGLCLVLGHNVRGGIYGAYGDLESLSDGEVATTVDFRTVYATIIDKYLKADSSTALGCNYPLLDFC